MKKYQAFYNQNIQQTIPYYNASILNYNNNISLRGYIETY